MRSTFTRSHSSLAARLCGSPATSMRRWTAIMLGSPEEIAANLRRLRDIAGDRLHVMFRVKYPGVSHDRVSKAIALLGKVRDLLNEPELLPIHGEVAAKPPEGLGRG